jgi:hypothetical protein
MKKVLAPSFEKPDHHLPKQGTVQPGDAFEDTTSKPGFEIVNF